MSHYIRRMMSPAGSTPRDVGIPLSNEPIWAPLVAEVEEMLLTEGSRGPDEPTAFDLLFGLDY